MIKILTYDQIDQQQWQELIEASATATWFQTDEAFQFYATVSEMIPFAAAVENDGKLRAVCVGYTTKENNAIKQHLTCRAIIIGGPLLADDATDEEVAALLQAIRRLGDKAIYVETRNFHNYSRWKAISYIQFRLQFYLLTR